MLEKLKKNSDVIYKLTDANLEIIYQESLTNILEFMKDFYPTLEKRKFEAVDSIYPGISKRVEEKDLAFLVFSGLLVVRRDLIFYAFDLAKPPTRGVSESNSEPESAFGARDGFVESYKQNIALIRTRIKDESLEIVNKQIGRRSKTNVSILSIGDIHNDEYKNKLSKMLDEIDIEAIISLDDLGAYLRGKNIFPTYQYIGTPDIASRRLLNGEIIVIIDRVSNVMALPTTIGIASRMTIDNINIPSMFSFVERLIINIAFLFSTIIVGLAISCFTFQSDTLSLKVLSILKVTQRGMIFPIAIEVLVILGLFELYYLIGFRQSKLTFSSIVVLIGGIIIGENLVTSGICGVILMTLTAVCFLLTFVVSSNVTIIASISIIRVLAIFASRYLGVYGVLVFSIALFGVLYQEEFLNVKYFSPFIPFDLEGISNYYVANASLKNILRSKVLNVKNKIRRKLWKN